MKLENIITIYFPTFVGILYFITCCAYMYKKDWAWAIIWGGYAFSQVGLVLAGNNH